jgi:hypothetical protein
VQIFLHTDPLTHWGCTANFLSECVNFVLITHNFFTHWLLHTRAANSLSFNRVLLNRFRLNNSDCRMYNKVEEAYVTLVTK